MLSVARSSCFKLLTEFSTNNLNCQSVRFRKPRWLPRAKSKMFKVLPRRKIPIEEELELRRLHNNYRTIVRSIRTFLQKDLKEETEVALDHEALNKKFEEDLQKTLLLNKEWAEQLKPIRENFMADLMKKKLDEALEKIEMKKMIRETDNAKVEELVRQVKADSKNFITAENIDEVIDKVIESTSDYNYALNLKGDKIV